MQTPPPPADTTAPETLIDSGPVAETTDTTASFAFSASEPGSTFSCKLDAADWSSCSSPVSYTALTVGEHTFSVRATDDAGNVDQTPASQSWIVQEPPVQAPPPPPPPPDTTAPETSITAQPASPTTATSASFSFASNEAGSSFACKLDSGSWTPCSSPQTYGTVAVGEHEFSVRATDGAGNTDSSPATSAWTVQAPPPPPPPPDTTAPETSIASGPAATTTATGASFSFSSSEAGSSFACKLDGGNWVACVSPQAYSGVTVGEHTFSVRATDAAGNTDPSPATQSWTVQSPPTGCSSTVA
ncbi:MAG TPA: Ig-like domain repeat protein, partial [Solirubrobacterales bacterium]